MARPLFLTNWLDPTFLFGINTLFSVVFLIADEKNQSLELRPLSRIPFELWNYVVDPAFFVGLLVLLAARHFVGNNAKPMSTSESNRAGWYLWNAVIFHVMMDGMSGGKWGNQLMMANYKILDFRFNDEANAGEAANAAVVVNMELFLYSWIVTIAYVGIATRARWRYEAEIVVLVMQLFGTFVFVLPEFLTGCTNMVSVISTGDDSGESGVCLHHVLPTLTFVASVHA